MSDDKRTLAERLADLDKQESDFVTSLKDSMSVGAFWQSDLVVIGAIKRSLGLASGFRRMIEDRNFTCAAPLVRLQLDTGLRLTAMRYVADPEAYAKAFLNGDKMDKFKTPSGAKLSDRFLVNQIKGEMPWVEAVYNDTCEFVHLSSRSVWNAIAKTENNTQKVWFAITAEDPPRITEDRYYEAIAAFSASLELTRSIAISYMEHMQKQRLHLSAKQASDK